MLELTLRLTSPYLIVDSKVQLSTPTTTNADEYFPNYQLIGKGRISGKEKGGSWLYVLDLTLYGAWALGNPMPELTLTPLKGIDQWEKRWADSGNIRYVSLLAILAEIFKQIGAGPILWEV